MIKTIFLLGIAFYVNATLQAQPIIAPTHEAVSIVQNGQSKGHSIGKPATQITATFSGSAYLAVVYFNLQIIQPEKITAKDKLVVRVNKVLADGREEYAWHLDIPISGVKLKASSFPVYSTFTEGGFKVQIVDGDEENSIFYSGKFTVAKPAGATRPDYKNNSSFVLCKKVDDDWNPVGLTTKIKAGECAQFLYKAKDKILVDNFMIWAIFKVKQDGSLEFSDELQQTVSNDGGKGYRFLSTDDICKFSAKGKYRVYLIEKAEWDSHHGDAEATEYFGKMEFIVE